MSFICILLLLVQEPYVETEGSGAAGCYDDEDCYQDEYNYYYEGSGSGEDTDEKPQQPAKVSLYSDYI